jgi:hypothetical protein
MNVFRKLKVLTSGGGAANDPSAVFLAFPSAALSLMISIEYVLSKNHEGVV